MASDVSGERNIFKGKCDTFTHREVSSEWWVITMPTTTGTKGETLKVSENLETVKALIHEGHAIRHRLSVQVFLNLLFYSFKDAGELLLSPLIREFEG